MVRLDANERNILYALLTVKHPGTADELVQAVDGLHGSDPRMERVLESLRGKLESPELDDDAVASLAAAAGNGELLSPRPYSIGQI